MGCCVGTGSFVFRDRKVEVKEMTSSPATRGVTYISCKMQSRESWEDYINGFDGVTEPYNDFLTISTTDPNEPDLIGRPILSISSSNSSTYSDSFYIDQLRSFDGLDERATNRYDIGLEILKAEIELGADPKVLHTHGDRSCLMFAVLANDIRFTKQLVELGVDVNQTNRLGETALGFAIEFGRRDIATYLCSKGAVLRVD
jgi:hypothetical protein